MSRPSLTLCMIAKNEEVHLPRCLASVRALVDDIVLVDTGSTDRTIEIAHSFGARVVHFPWQDDFSLARNAALEHATGDWILSLDADETIAERDHAAIRDALETCVADAVLVSQRHYLAQTVVGWQAGSGGYDEGLPYSGFVDVECRRLFRNRPWLRFRNRVHEDLLSNDPAHPLSQVRGTWVIHHFGKVGSGEVLRAKGEAYVRIGTKKAEEHPHDPQAHYELGIQYSELGRPADALPCFQRVQALKAGYRDVSLHLALSYVHLGRHEDALRWLPAAARELPHRGAEVALVQGNAHRALGNRASARRAFSKALTMKPGYAAASLNLAELYQQDGRPSDALHCLDRAIALGPKHTELRLLRARLRRDAGNDDGALEDLEAVGEIDAALRLRARILIRQGRFHDARDVVGRIDVEHNADVESLRGAIALGLGNLDAAEQALRRSIAVDVTLDAMRNLATVLRARGDRAGALAAAAQAVSRADDPGTLQLFEQLAGDTFSRRGDTADPDRLTIFFVQKHGPSYDGTTPRTRALGGTESAIVYLASALARLGHRVAVFNNSDAPASVDGVEYGRFEQVAVRAVSDRPDAIVAVRCSETIAQVRLAPLQIFWTGDAYDQPYVEQLRDRVGRGAIDFVMLQSRWQRETFQRHQQLPAWQILETKLGAAATATPAAVPPVSTAPRPRRLAYASTPYRGLDVLLELFPRIRRACPDAELDVFSSMAPYGLDGEQDRKRYDAIYRRADQPGVNLVGSVSQVELAERLRHARALAYPNHFPETFCIAAIEAQAAGCPVITSRLGALPETVGDAGICIDGDPRSENYGQAFVDACVALLQDDERSFALSRVALERAWTSYAWPAIALEWERVLKASLAPEAPVVERVAVHLSAGRSALAARMLDREPRPTDLPEHVWTALRTIASDPERDVSDDTLRELAIHCPSLRRLRVVEALATRGASAR